MPDVLKRLAGPAILPATANTRYTVPGSTTAVVRNIHVCNETASVATLTVSVGTDAAGKRLFKDLAIPANGAYDWSGSLVLDAGEVVQAFSGTASALSLTLSGIESTST